MSMLQLRWRTQSKIAQSEFISDSVSSIKNISNISNSSIRRSIGVGPQVRGKLVRSTSTPVNAEFAVAKPKDPTFNSSGEHVSSIYASGCDVESPAVQNPTGGTPSKQALDHKNRYRKSNRTKLPAVTPLRQVMSKSIQKAMVEHGLCIPNSGNNLADAPLDLRLSPAMRRTQSDISDLGRRSSLLHKAQLNREHLSQKLTEQIVITKTKHLTSVESVTDSNAELAIKSNSTSNSSAQSSIDSASTTSTNSVYQTCHSVEIITSTELSEVNIQKESCNGGAEAIDFIKPLKDFPKTQEHNFDTITPITRKQKVLKKIIQFETPQIEAELDKDINTSSNSEVFYTPTSTPLRKSSIRINTKNSDCAEVYNEAVPLNLSAKLSPRKQRSLIDDSAQIPTHNNTESFNEDDNDNVFLQDNKNGTEKSKGPVTSATTGAGRLWSIMSSVIRLPSFSGKRELSDDDDNNNNKHSLLKRCASIAGSLVRPKPLVDEEHLQSLKRKRTYTLDNQYQLDMGNTITSPCADGSSVSSKRFRIYGRKPIDRMRVN